MTGSVYRSLPLRRLFITSLIGFGLPAFAGLDVKTVYDINNYRTDARTEFKKAPLELDSKLNEGLWDQFQAKLKEMPVVGDVQAGAISETKTDPGTWADYLMATKNFSVFVQLTLNKPVTLLFSVEQSRKICKDPAAVKQGTQTSTCGDLDSSIEIKGPIAVYGTFESESSLNVSDLMRDKQRLMVSVSRSSDKADLIMLSSIYIDSMLFEKSLLKFFDVFSVKSINKKSEDLTRQSILLGVARVMRQVNERMLEL